MDNRWLSDKGGIVIKNYSFELFICFVAKDRYTIAESIVYHLENYGIQIWYDRHSMLMGDDRQKKNIDEGAKNCKYAIAIISQNTVNSKCALEELSILKSRLCQEAVTIFPVLYEITPDELPHGLDWIRNIIFKEIDRHSGTREICNHIACKITEDYTCNYKCKNVQEIIDSALLLPSIVKTLLKDYVKIDHANLNARVALLYATYISIFHSMKMPINSLTTVAMKIFQRLFAETRLNLEVDYREIWLLENAICVLIEHGYSYCTESNI